MNTSHFVRYCCLVMVTLFSSNLWADWPIKCDRRQTKCEIETNRLTIDDYVAVLNSNDILIAWGTVTDFKGSVRQIRIKKRFGRILKSHRAIRIDDNKTSDIEKNFKVFRKRKKSFVLTGVGVASLGIGKGLAAATVDASGYWYWKKGLYYVGRIYGLSGSSTAGYIDSELLDAEISLSSFGLVGGIGSTYKFSEQVFLISDFSLGVGVVTGQTSASVDFAAIVDNRVVPGTSPTIVGMSRLTYDLKPIMLWFGFWGMTVSNVFAPGLGLGVGFEL